MYIIIRELSVKDSLKDWEVNAQFWDDSMGDESNKFHREVIRPKVSELLDIVCGNGIFVFATQHPCFVTLTDKYVTALKKGIDFKKIIIREHNSRGCHILYCNK